MRTYNRIYKVMTALLAVCVIMQCGIIAFAEIKIPDATSCFYVNDFADVFTDAQEEEMLLRAEALASKPEGVQVVITTVKTLDGATVEDYATSMYNKYQIGREDRGVLILLSTGERKIRVEVGYGLESYLTDSKSGKFLDSIMDYLRNNKFDIGLLKLQEALVVDLDNHYESLRKPAETPRPTVQVTVAPAAKPVSKTATQTETRNAASSVSEETGSDKDRGHKMVVITLSSTVILIFLFSAFIIYYLSKGSKIKIGRLQDKLQDEKEKHSNEERRLKKDCDALIYQKEEELSRMRQNSSDESTQHYREMERLRDNHRDEISKLKRQNSEEVDRREEVESKFAALQRRYKYALKCYPTLDSDIDSYIQKETDERNRRIAADYDKKYKNLLDVQASSEIDFSAFDRAISEYERLDSEQKKYVTTSVEELRKISRASRDLLNRKKAGEFSELARKACDGVSQGTEENLSKFEGIMKTYGSMSGQQKEYVDAAVIAILNRLITQGKNVRDERLAKEEAERRRIEAERRRQEEERRRKEEEERKRREEEERKRREEEERKRREEERRRREREEEEHRARMRRMSSSSSSFGGSSHSHFGGGFGGHSGGGGASRGF